ncbi:MAG: hypothetical protein NVS2B6_19680 [Thermoleophilaceae bacterium]
MQRTRGTARPAAAAVRALTLASLALALVTQPAHAALSEAAAPPGRPQLRARAGIVVDARTGETLFAQNAETHLPIASTTKLMTALLTLERSRPDTFVTSPGYAGTAAESRIGLVAGERMTVHDLLEALLLPSANDAAVTLATAVGGGAPAFVAAMNARARTLGLRETHYSNPVGLDARDNYSSAHDLARLASYLLANPTFAAIVDQPSARLTTGNHPRTVINRNVLVRRYPFVTGVKTGHTAIAGYVLVGSARVAGAQQVVSVALGDPSEATRDSDSLALLRYGLGEYHTVNAVQAGSTVARAKVSYYDGSGVSLEAATPIVVTAHVGRAVTTRIDAPRELSGPLPRGARVGRVTAFYQGRAVGSVPLTTTAAVRGAGLLRKLRFSAGGWLAALACLLLAAAAALVLLRGRAARGGGVSDDHHRHAQRRNRQDARRAELPARPPSSRRRADLDGRRQGRERRPRP